MEGITPLGPSEAEGAEVSGVEASGPTPEVPVPVSDAVGPSDGDMTAASGAEEDAGKDSETEDGE